MEYQPGRRLCVKLCATNCNFNLSNFPRNGILTASRRTSLNRISFNADKEYICTHTWWGLRSKLRKLKRETEPYIPLIPVVKDIEIRSFYDVIVLIKID